MAGACSCGAVKLAGKFASQLSRSLTQNKLQEERNRFWLVPHQLGELVWEVGLSSVLLSQGGG